MEELRSTEILDLEIENDARKRAEKILNEAQNEQARILSEVETNVKEAENKQKNYYQEKLLRFENNLKAAVPLEKRRFLVDFYFNSVSAAMNEFFAKLSQDKILELLRNKFNSCIKNFSDKVFNAFYFGLDAKAAEKELKTLLGSKLASAKETSFALSGEEPFPGNNLHAGYVLISDDNNVKIRVTSDQIVRELREKYNYQLTTALFNGGLPE